MQRSSILQRVRDGPKLYCVMKVLQSLLSLSANFSGQKMENRCSQLEKPFIQHLARVRTQYHHCQGKGKGEVRGGVWSRSPQECGFCSGVRVGVSLLSKTPTPGTYYSLVVY